MEFSSGPSHSGLGGSPNPFNDYFPFLECTIRIDILSTWHNPHISSQICGVNVIMVKEPK